MLKNYVIGFPRIGEQRELKKVLEKFWAKTATFNEVQEVASQLKAKHWKYQKDVGIDFISSNDFSLYDNMLDTSIMLGAIPARFKNLKDEELYFAMARGNANNVAMEMTKWFNTNYHYIVPELSLKDTYALNTSKIINEYHEAKKQGISTKINIIGPITYLGLSKRTDGGDIFELTKKIVDIYEKLLQEISKLDTKVYVQIDEPIFVKDLDTKVLSLIKPIYDRLANATNNIKLIIATYFEHSNEATKILVHTPVWALALDFVYGKKNLQDLDILAQSDKIVIAGIVNGRNIWRNHFDKTLILLQEIGAKIPDERLYIGSSCSLLHVPFTLQYEDKMDPEIKNWLSYAIQKLDEIALLAKIYHVNKNDLTDEQQIQYQQNIQANDDRKASIKIHNQNVLKRVNSLTKTQRDGKYEERIKLQKEILNYNVLATTTIGSFPQTTQIREARRAYKKTEISHDEYIKVIKSYINECIRIQEDIGLEVLVHGEPERNDMVEYFGEQLDGYGFSQNGWVQSYGSRCVKPPFIYGDISRANPMTVEWITYAQSKTTKPVKAMLTGPVTILNWSFIRDDKAKSEVAKQIALAIHDEIEDLQNANINIIQVDEAAFKEGYPLRKADIKDYEKWAVENFKLSVSSAKKQTQIHTHMCYSEFNDIIETIEDMDADVISIETARSGNELLRIFKDVGYKQEVGPGVYDIHSPRIPSVKEIVTQIEKLLEVLPKEQLWINPDCGLKTRKWDEVIPSLKNMVEAVKIVRAKFLS